MWHLMQMIDSERRFSPRQSLSLILTMLLLSSHLSAQGRNQPAVPRPSGLTIYVLEGKGAINYIPDGKGTTPVVEIRDDNGFPVSGAAVVFSIPETGPGGDFPNGKHTLDTVTDLAGQAQAPFTVRPQPGTFSIQVGAKIDTRSASAVITQVNSLKASDAAKTTTTHHWYKNWKILAIAGAGVVALVVILATRGGSGASSGTAVGLSPGVPSFGAPH